MSEFKESNQASWIGTAYLLSSCTFTPLYGRLCTTIGRRAACQIALCTTVLGTFLCAGSRSMVELTVARFVCRSSIDSAGLKFWDSWNGRRGAPVASDVSLYTHVRLGLGGTIGGILNDLVGWRAVFLCEVPFFVSVAIIITKKMYYTTPGQGQSAKEVLCRIDFGGLIALFLAIGSTLIWLSTKFNEGLPWTNLRVVILLILSLLSFGVLLVVEFCIAREPILPPCLLREKVAVWVSLSNFFLSACNYSVTFFVPLWFQTVSLDSAAIAGLHLLPNSVATGLDSLMGGWIIHQTGKCTTLNLVFGILPFSGLVSLIFIREDSGFIQKWLSVLPIGLGNAVVVLIVMIALQAHLPESLIPCGTAVAQLSRGLGQVSSIAIASAIFQSRLDTELRQRIHIPDADKIISEIRHSFSLVVSLPPDLQRAAQDAYAASLRTVFMVGTCSLLVSYFIRLPIPEAPMEKRSEHADRTDSESRSQLGPESEPDSEYEVPC
ncbi:major facilitator superfamily domain-containing protein [Chiua virens]|nr:major facilitator superfamily domain-containing protein [Chiua virens]